MKVIETAKIIAARISFLLALPLSFIRSRFDASAPIPPADGSEADVCRRF
jgi:hypothetical protein